jgi:hypothetical protein
MEPWDRQRREPNGQAPLWIGTSPAVWTVQVRHWHDAKRSVSDQTCATNERRKPISPPLRPILPAELGSTRQQAKVTFGDWAQSGWTVDPTDSEKLAEVPFMGTRECRSSETEPSLLLARQANQRLRVPSPRNRSDRPSRTHPESVSGSQHSIVGAVNRGSKVPCFQRSIHQPPQSKKCAPRSVSDVNGDPAMRSTKASTRS